MKVRCTEPERQKKDSGDGKWIQVKRSGKDEKPMEKVVATTIWMVWFVAKCNKEVPNRTVQDLQTNSS